MKINVKPVLFTKAPKIKYLEMNYWSTSKPLTLNILKIETLGERVEREVGGGIGMGNTCKPMAVSFQCMTKFTTNKK